MTNLINNYIPEVWDDKVFYFAEKIQYHKKSGWGIYINPENCLVGMASYENGMPTIQTLHNDKIKYHKVEDGFIVEGRLLVSAGVLFFLDDKLLLFQRDADAPFAPLKWTSPAGRVDRDPLLTSLKEFHEELIFLDQKTGKPVYIYLDETPFQTQIRNAYEKTLSYKGYTSNARNWINREASIGLNNKLALYDVVTYFDSEKNYSSLSGKARFFSFFNRKTNTLELLLPMTLSSKKLGDIILAYVDGEYDRKIATYTLSDFKKLPDNDLVGTMMEFKQICIENNLS